MARGQPRQDIAYRTRNWIWYWMIRYESGLSDEALDDLYAKARDNPAVSLGAFSRIRSMGSSPCDPRGFRKSQPIFDAVHCEENRKAGRFEKARQAFESPLWELLSTRDMPLTRLQEIIADIAQARGLTRIQPNETYDIYTVIPDQQLLTNAGLMVDDQRALADILRAMDLDTTAMLAALYHEALRTMQHQRALMLRDFIGVPLGIFLSTFQPPDPMFALMMHLLTDRILCDYWATEHDWFEATGREPSGSTSETTRQREINDFVEWYVGGKRNARRHAPPGLSLPMVEPLALSWLRDNRDEIRSLRGDIERQQASMSGESAELPKSTQARTEKDTLKAREIVARNIRRLLMEERE